MEKYTPVRKSNKTQMHDKHNHETDLTTFLMRFERFISNLFRSCLSCHFGPLLLRFIIILVIIFSYLHVLKCCLAMEVMMVISAANMGGLWPGTKAPSPHNQRPCTPRCPAPGKWLLTVEEKM